MAKKNKPKITAKKEIRQLVATDLEALMGKINPEMGDKKIKQKIKKAGKILVKGIKSLKTTESPKEKVSAPA